MTELRCKECGENYHGDPSEVRLCDMCYKDYSEGRGYSDEEIAEQFAPTEDEIALAEGMGDEEE